MVDYDNYPLSEGAIKEFTLHCGIHFKLALCERTIWCNQKIKCILYVTDDKQRYVREIIGGLREFCDNTQSGLALSDLIFYMDFEYIKFIRWL